MIELPKHSDLLKLPELLYGIIKKIGVLNNEPILYGDVNLLKLDDLFYFASAHQIYRYVGTRRNNAALPILPGIGIENPIGGGILDPIEPQVVEYQTSYIFEEIEPMLDGFMSNGLTIPDELRGTVKRVGKLFDKIIYSGDPNLVDSGNLYYHEAFPLISTVGISGGVITLSADWIGMYGNVSTMNVEYRVSPHNYSKDYLTIEALEDGKIFFIKTEGQSPEPLFDISYISYSTDNGKTWNTYTVEDMSEEISITVNVNAGDKILWKGEAIQYGDYPDDLSSGFNGDITVNVSGNIMSMIWGDDFKKHSEFKTNSHSVFCGLFGSEFRGYIDVIDASNLILPANNLVEYCYAYLFFGCYNLEAAPKLLSTNLAESCYALMFGSCASLTAAPELPATTLTNYCYQSMFSDCSSLVTAPELPATTLADYCYYSMFVRCSSLNNIKMLAIDISATNCLQNWVEGVSATGTFIKNSAAEWDVTGTSGIPSGWTVETADT